MTFSIFAVFAFMMISSMNAANAELSYGDQLEFANSIEEISGHILAAKKNIVAGNSEQASLHLAHPIDQLYDDIHKELKTVPKVDKKLEFSLYILKNTNTDVDIDFFDKQANEIFKVLDETKLALIPVDTVNDSTFKLNTITNLLEMSKMNYDLGLQSSDELIELVLIDDSYAFVIRAEEILDSINDLELDQKHELKSKFEQTLLSISNEQSLVDITIQFDNIVDDIEDVKKNGLGFEIAMIALDSSGFGEAGIIGDDGLGFQETHNDSIVFEESSIPSWIKLNAAWWADDIVTDDEFLSGIEYLIEQKILMVSAVQAPIDSLDDKIPSWIKNRTGWWADGLLSDIEFLSGIEYMIEKRILVV